MCERDINEFAAPVITPAAHRPGRPPRRDSRSRASSHQLTGKGARPACRVMGGATHAWRRPWGRGAFWGSWPRDTGASGDRTDTLAAASELRGATSIPVGRHHATTRGGVDGLAPESGECMARRPRRHGACAAQALPSCRCCRSETQGRSGQGPRAPSAVLRAHQGRRTSQASR